MRQPPMLFALLLELGEILDGSDHLAGVGVLVVIPADDLDLISIVVHLADHGLGGVEDGTVAALMPSTVTSLPLTTAMRMVVEPVFTGTR